MRHDAACCGVLRLSAAPCRTRCERSHAGAVAKYCNEYVCLWVCLSFREDIPGTTRAIFTKFLCMLPMPVARSSSGTLTTGSIAYWLERATGVHSAGEVKSTISLFNVSKYVVGVQRRVVPCIVLRPCTVLRCIGLRRRIPCVRGFILTTGRAD